MTAVSAASRMRTSWRAPERDSSITQARYCCNAKDRLTGRMFKGIKRHAHTDIPCPVHQVLVSACPPCVCVCVSFFRPCHGRCWPARERRAEEGEWKSQLTERSLVCLLECLWEPLTVNLSSWKKKKTKPFAAGEWGNERGTRERMERKNRSGRSGVSTLMVPQC